MVPIHVSLSYYKQEAIRQKLVDGAIDKEIAIRYGEKGFGKRPDTLSYSSDILEAAKKGATSFHASEELWHNPSMIQTGMKASELTELRKGWDLLLDIDCAHFPYSRLAAYYIIAFLEYKGLKTIGVKFSGNKGFHIGVPFEAFPDHLGTKPLAALFPEAPRKIAEYIKESIKDKLSAAIFDHAKKEATENNIEPFGIIEKNTGMTSSELITRETSGGQVKTSLNVEPFLEIDTILISSRHLYRMEYSLNEKSGLASVQLDVKDIMSFERDHASPQNIKIVDRNFFERDKAHEDEGKRLLIDSYDFESQKTVKVVDVKPVESSQYLENWDDNKEIIPAECFPPCMHHLFQGITDGKKRMLFALCNFMRKMNWPMEKAKEVINDWNDKNEQPLRQVFVERQLSYTYSQREALLPPNCDHMAYYKAVGVCKPDSLCTKIKNPVNYGILRAKMLEELKKKERKKTQKKVKKNSQEGNSGAEEESGKKTKDHGTQQKQASEK